MICFQCHSEPLGDESLSNLARDISLSLNMTEDFSHSDLKTKMTYK